jgi:hypothetical protein
MERAAVQPRDQERALLSERAVHVRCGQAVAPRPDRQARSALILALDRQQSLRDRHRIACAFPCEELGGQAGLEDGGAHLT